ncbi:hypothetical protein GF359_02160 [candidate division WOR-3 bacterium]|uniref:Uncharacterized protein n=1 Tax=candidate division WOR-3 bacterium TaxID=2052148 RepID=A0A9D5K827_UNCW3|nr:hypothetical protein [candidate division WOR-3 bacterium]MBD3363997.1 hypothetical protein [candidate division WOR-3 bacterium]
MSFLLFFLGFGQFKPEAEQPVKFFEDRWFSSLVSIDPVQRIRAAWFIPDFFIKADTLSIWESRPYDVRYVLDNTPLWDPQTGEVTIMFPRTFIIDQELSAKGPGLVPVVTLHSRRRLKGWHGELTGTFPFFAPIADSSGYADLMLNVPLGKILNVSLDGAAIVDNQRPERSQHPPRQGLAAYTGVASLEVNPSDEMLIRLRYLRVVEQKDNYTPEWTFNPASTPAELTEADLLFFNYMYRTDVLDLEFGLSSYNSYLLSTGRDSGDLRLFRWFTEQPEDAEPAAKIANNPFGVKDMFYSSGRNPVSRARNSTVDRAFITVGISAGHVSELKAHLDYSTCNLITDISSWEGGDEYNVNYQETPRLANIYLGDRLKFVNFWIEPGLGAQYLENFVKIDSLDTEEYRPRLFPEPGIQARWQFYGFDLQGGTVLSAAVPPLHYFYDYADNTPIPDSLALISTEDASAEYSWQTWLDAEKDWGNNLYSGTDIFTGFGFKRLASRIIPDDTTPSAGIFNTAEVFSFGISPWVAYYGDWFAFTAAYRYYSGKGTSGGVYKDYQTLLSGDSLTEGYKRLPYDSRHKLTVETEFRSPQITSFWLRDFYLEPRIAFASGFPDEQPEDGFGPVWSWFEVTAGREINIGDFQAEITAEFLNPFGWSEPILGTVAEPGLPTEEDFPERITLSHPDYHPSRDANHDGCITAAEEVEAYARARAYYNEVTPSPLPARSIELKLAVRF